MASIIQSSPIRTCLRRPLSVPRSISSRASRVNFLLTLVVVLSALDLGLTLFWMSTIGMYESNPLVALLARLTGSPLILCAFKVMSVIICVGVLSSLREHVQAEFGAWTAACVLLALAVRWVNYAHVSTQFSAQAMCEFAGNDGEWVRLQ